MSDNKPTNKIKTTAPMDVFADNVAPINVNVRDINMSFTSMVIFMVKWVIASIPAFIILFIIGMVVVAVFGAGMFTLFN